MNMINIAQDDAFSFLTLTAKVNLLPRIPFQISESKLFQSEGIDTTTLAIEKFQGRSALVAYSPRGGVGETIERERSHMRSFSIPHLERLESVLADEVQNVRQFGTVDQRETVSNKIVQRLARHFRDFDMTEEHQKIGAIKGIVLDKFGNQVENLYTAFEVAVPTVVNMALDVGSTQVRSKSDDIFHSIQDSLEGFIVTSATAWCGRNFFQQLINHTDVREIYKAAGATQALLGKTPTEITIGRITYKVYDMSPSAAQAASLGDGFIAADEAVVVPDNVPDMFITRYAPADYEDTVNTIGLPRYARVIQKRNHKGYDIEVQSNPISINTQPQAVRRLTVTS